MWVGVGGHCRQKLAASVVEHYSKLQMLRQFCSCYVKSTSSWPIIRTAAHTELRIFSVRFGVISRDIMGSMHGQWMEHDDIRNNGQKRLAISAHIQKKNEKDMIQHEMKWKMNKGADHSGSLAAGSRRNKPARTMIVWMSPII